MKKLFIIIVILLFAVSCKDDVKKTNNNESSSTVISSSVKTYKGDYLYKAYVNNKEGAVLEDASGGKLTEIPFEGEVLITKLLNFETVYVMNKVKVHGQWVEVVYQNGKDILKGKVFDGYLDYKAYQKKTVSQVDTVVVKNEREFFKALTSNRTIIVETKEINLDKGRAIIENSEDEGMFYGVSYADDYTESLLFSNFSNLEIKGKGLVDFITYKDEADVIDFENCNDIYFDNINFYHKEVPSCGGDVLNFSECSNFYFQNSHLDGSGLIAVVGYNSSNLNFVNCDFYNNHSDIVYVLGTSSVNLKRCNIYKNELNDMFSGSYLEDCVKCESKINISDCYIIDNETDCLVENDGIRYWNVKIENSLVTNNNFKDDMINLVSDSNIFLKNTNFIGNVSASNKYFFDKEKNVYPKVYLENVLFEENIDFYDFKRDGIDFLKKERIKNNDIYNQKSDTLLTDFNSYYLNGVHYKERSDKDFKINKETIEFSVNGHLFQGQHKLSFSRYNDFYSFFYSESSPSNYYVGLGNFIDGKLEGEWQMSTNSFKDIVEYKDGMPVEMRREVLVKKNPKETQIIKEGVYVDGKMNGVFQYYFEDGTLQKQLTFKEGVLDYPQEYYFPNGNKRFVRHAKSSEYYHPNGTIIAELIHNEVGEVVLNESNFYDLSESLKEVKQIPLGVLNFYIDGGVSIKFDGVENHTDKVFFVKRNDLIEFAHYDNSIARYKLKNGSFLHESLNLKIGANDYAECYKEEDKKTVYVFDNHHTLLYKAITEYEGEDKRMDLYIYKRENGLKEAFKQYIYKNKKYILHGNVHSYYRGNVYAVRYENGKRIKN